MPPFLVALIVWEIARCYKQRIITFQVFSGCAGFLRIKIFSNGVWGAEPCLLPALDLCQAGAGEHLPLTLAKQLSASRAEPTGSAFLSFGYKNLHINPSVFVKIIDSGKNPYYDISE